MTSRISTFRKSKSRIPAATRRAMPKRWITHTRLFVLHWLIVHALWLRYTTGAVLTPMLLVLVAIAFAVIGLLVHRDFPAEGVAKNGHEAKEARRFVWDKLGPRWPEEP